MNTTNQEPLPKPMQSIGERLEEARKRMGVSIREATETTKLRTDVIDSFEGNRFDFDLPEIYKRGFLRIYAQFLKLDSDQILTDYQAIWLTKSRGNNAPHPNEPRRTFGHLHLSNAPVAKPEAQEHTPLAQSKETVTTAEPESPDNLKARIVYRIGKMRTSAANSGHKKPIRSYGPRRKKKSRSR